MSDTPRSEAILLQPIGPLDRAYKMRLLAEELERENTKLRAELVEECDAIECGGSRTYWGLTNPAKLERLDRLNALLGRPRHEKLKS